MTNRQREELAADLERIHATVEKWADLLDPHRKPRTALPERVRLLVVPLDQIGTQATHALTHLRLGHA